MHWLSFFWFLCQLKWIRYTFLCIKPAWNNTSLFCFHRKSILQRILPEKCCISLILLFVFSLLRFLCRSWWSNQNVFIRMIWKFFHLIQIIKRTIHFRHIIFASISHYLRHLKTAHWSHSDDIHMSITSNKSLLSLFWFHDHSLFTWICTDSYNALLSVS